MDAKICVHQYQQAFEPLRNPVRAEAMRAYLRGQFTFLGLPAPVRRAAVRPLISKERTKTQLLDTVFTLWTLAPREYRYAAIDLLSRWQRLLEASDIPRLIALANRDPWWETVDGLSAVISDILLADQKKGRFALGHMLDALVAESMWTRRIAMTHQIGWRQYTNEP